MRLDRDDQERVIAITRELDTLRLHPRTTGVEHVLPEITELLGLEGMLLYSIGMRVDRVALERWSVHQLPELFVRLFKDLITDDPSLLTYDFARPDKPERNRPVEVNQWIERDDPGAWQRSELYRRVFVPSRMHDRRFLRTLVCEGPKLLGCIGGVQREPVTVRQTSIMAALVPALRRRLMVERRLMIAPRAQAMLHAVLEQLPTPAFLVDARGEIQELNSAGRVMLDRDGDGLRRGLRAAVDRTGVDFELVEIRDAGALLCYLATTRPDPELRRIALVQAATHRWSLTKKQAEVLSYIVQGFSNAAIAKKLAVGERAIELHVSGILDRAGVDSRSALVSKVLA